MKRVLSNLCHSLLVVALLHGQLAFAVPGVPTLFGPGCSKQMSMDDAAPAQHQDHDAQHARSADQELLSGLCLNEQCCNGCGTCGHCFTALVSPGIALVPPTGEAPDDTVPWPSQFYIAPNPHPPRALHQS